jgi:hypothetical protein
MRDPFYSYFIRSGWRERDEAPAAIGAKFVKTLDTLSSIDPIFAAWVIVEHLFDLRSVRLIPLADARSRIAAIVEDNVPRNEFGKPSLARGYHANARAGEFKDPRSVSFNVTAGGRYENGAKLEFAEYDVAPDLAIITYPLFKAALLEINAIWQAPWACAQAFRSGAVAVPTTEFGGRWATESTALPKLPATQAFPIAFFTFRGSPISLQNLPTDLRQRPQS